MIDTEPSQGGDIYKMLLGSFVPWYDYLDNEIENTPTSNTTSPYLRPQPGHPGIGATLSALDNPQIPHYPSTSRPRSSSQPVRDGFPGPRQTGTWQSINSEIVPDPEQQRWAAAGDRHNIYGVPEAQRRHRYS